ncbi:MAG: NADPH:quinone reductase [Porticoccaceae bacterium]|nr:NADPH:quinone reductase [Porticoccaceae bacterium]
MKAAWFDSFGDVDKVIQIGDQPKPVVGEGQVLIKLATSGVNPSDVKKRAGAFSNLLDDGLIIPHSDGAGIIEEVGQGINEARIGERVWIYQAQYGRRFGTSAEYIAIDSNRAILLPINTDFTIGACLGIPAMTAHRCVHADGDIEGQILLITGGAGRVGYYAIQWAVMAGAKVIATASNSSDQQLCLSLGATAVVNHNDNDWGQQVSEAINGEKVHRVIDVEFGTNLPHILCCIATGGVIATYSSTQVRTPSIPFLDMMYKDLTLRMVIVYAMPEKAKMLATEDITRALEIGALKHRVAHTLPLEEIPEAHKLIESGKVKGCVVISMESNQ